MKKALLFALSSLLSAFTPALAYPPAANVNFTSEHDVAFGLALDGQPLTQGVVWQVHVDRLAPGAHWADFTLPTSHGAVHFRSRVWLEPGLETTFVLIARPGWPLDLQQVGAVALLVPGYGNGYGNQNGHNGGGRYNSSGNNGPGYGFGYNGPGYDNGYGNGNGNGNGNNGPAYPSPNNGNGNYDPNSGYNSAPGTGGSYGGSAANYRLMQPQDVTALVQAVQQRPSEASKLSIAKDALSQSSIQADDLKRLLRSFGFEASRVELAKFAYSHVADRQNFYRVYQAFDYDASVQEVQQAVANRSN